jgi:plasmid stabilization system protein ParE
MKEPCEFLWAAVDEKALLEIIDFIAEDECAISLKTLNTIRTAASRLDRPPGRGRIVPELLMHGMSRYREIVIAPWRVIYRIEGKKGYVVSVIDGRRNVEDILLARLLK